jgi:general secretion pathway protein C
MLELKAFEGWLQWTKKSQFLQGFCLLMALLIGWNIWSGSQRMSRLTMEIQQKTSQLIAPMKDNTPNLSSHSLVPLFGDYVPQNLDAAGVSQSMLNLTVVGIVYAINENNSQVILQSPNGQEQFYRVGDTLPEGGEIKRITVEGVLVLREGHLERLSMEKEQLRFDDAASPFILDEIIH